MKKVLLSLLVIVVLISCSQEKETNMTVKGQIKGLKKGKLYLQKMKDTLLIDVDSVALNGSDVFELKDYVKSPIVYYLTFDANNAKKSILFFGEEGTITINDNVKDFGFNPEINGSKNQKILDRYNEVSREFNNQRLDFVKRDFEAKKANDVELIEALEKDYRNMVRRRVLFTTNFALINADSEVAPYIALTEMYDASLKMLDTVNNSLSERIKLSNYGKRLQEYIDDIKTNNKK